jgi:acyl carrier protein
MVNRVVGVLEGVLKRKLDGADAHEKHLHDLGLDSIGMIDLLGALEEEFSVQIDPDDVGPENFESVRAICDYLSGRAGE